MRYEYTIFVLPLRTGPDHAEQLAAIGCQPDEEHGGTIPGATTTTDLDVARQELRAIRQRFDWRPGYDVIRGSNRFSVTAHQGEAYCGAGSKMATWFIARRPIDPSEWEPLE